MKKHSRGKPGQGHYTPSVGGDLGSDTRTGPNKRPRRRVSSSSGASALASQDGDAKQAPEDSDDEDHQASVQRAQARLVAHIRDPQVRRWARGEKRIALPSNCCLGTHVQPSSLARS